MFTEYEIETLIENEVIKKATFELKKEFIKNEAPYLEISDQDFFSLIVMTPTVGVALANGSVSLWEEMALNKKARKLSKGGYFMKKDPVVFGLKYLIKQYDNWEDSFLGIIRLTMEETFSISKLEAPYDKNQSVSESAYRDEVLKAPYILIRFLSSFFLDDDEDIISQRSISKVDFGRVQSIGEKLGLHKIPLFHYFCSTFKVN
ncbi:hypothetical protein SAMN04488029_0183 [Reichenbachiella faecimaris]|uniref:Uncharacterized protein n=1 Tax=Reichenbachiella faecimaris TaxID=692418 RepID=A0A1W2G598_REIFA|nr:hypothetical protein [Reichenbachiella faecimaris]SMD31845.1 hypothetical protein SAMN04488029_0183 [Reichenbachiella faecimaris]